MLNVSVAEVFSQVLLGIDDIFGPQNWFHVLSSLNIDLRNLGYLTIDNGFINFNIHYKNCVCVVFSDVDECSQDNGPCHSTAACVNTPGSYECLCEIGYRTDGDRCIGKFDNGRGVMCSFSTTLLCDSIVLFIFFSYILLKTPSKLSFRDITILVLLSFNVIIREGLHDSYSCLITSHIFMKKLKLKRTFRDSCNFKFGRIGVNHMYRWGGEGSLFLFAFKEDPARIESSGP